MIDFLRLVAIVQGLACMAAVIAAGLATGNHIAWMCAIISLGLGFLSTTSMTIDKGLFWLANGLTVASICLGLAAVVALI